MTTTCTLTSTTNITSYSTITSVIIITITISMYACVSPANQCCAKVAACLNIYIYMYIHILYIYIYTCITRREVSSPKLILGIGASKTILNIQMLHLFRSRNRAKQMSPSRPPPLVCITGRERHIREFPRRDS